MKKPRNPQPAWATSEDMPLTAQYRGFALSALMTCASRRETATIVADEGARWGLPRSVVTEVVEEICTWNAEGADVSGTPDAAAIVDAAYQSFPF